mmetsp:Transcript_45800/g.90205  ORF Transcript_45800/g.90205 Transcript_45800/m.90205 type:complete len:94 (+) Transcript_45800:242-523(+)
MHAQLMNRCPDRDMACSKTLTSSFIPRFIHIWGLWVYLLTGPFFLPASPITQADRDIRHAGPSHFSRQVQHRDRASMHARIEIIHLHTEENGV